MRRALERERRGEAKVIPILVRSFDWKMGPFADLVGTLQRLDGADRVHVLLDLLGRSVSTTLPYEALAPAA